MTKHAAEDHRATPSESGSGGGLVGLVTARRTAWAFALLPLLLAGAVMGLLGEGERDPSSTDALPAGYDSTAAVELADRLPTDDASTAVVLLTSEESLTEQDVDALSTLLTDLGALPTGPGGPDSSGGSGSAVLQVSDDGTAALAVVPVEAATSTENADAVTALREALADGVPAGVTAAVTGPAGIQADLAAVFEGADLRLLGATAAVVAVLLVITYRSPVLWLVPLTVVAVADRLAAVLATQVLELVSVPWDESTVGILSVLVFGAGTDYALLLISRYRDELRATEDRFAAMAVAVRRTAESVLASATTVVLGVLTLLLSLVPTTRGLGLACAVGIVVAAAFALLVLPAAMVLPGRWIFWPRVPRTGQTALSDSRSLWRRVGDVVAARPVVVAGATVAVLAALAAGLLDTRTGLDQADQFLDTPESITAAERLAESFPAGSSDPTTVLTTDDADTVLGVVTDVDGVGSARVSGEGDGVTEVTAVLDAAPSSDEAEATVERLRDAVAAAGLTDTHVGGSEAEALDARDGAARDRLLLFPLILGLVLAGLALLLRSVVAAVLLVVTVVATYAAALGVSWWIFTGVFGFSALDVSTPLFAFLFLVALGVDYNIFLATRAREEAAEHGTREGMLRALAATGGVITSAGILLAAVFAVLGVLPLVVLAQIGTVICVGVLLDTLVVRTVLVPSLALLLGDRFWWPSRPAAG